MYRFISIILIFCVSATAFSVEASNSIILSEQAIVTGQKHAEIMPASMALLLVAIGLALVFWDDHIKKARDRNKDSKK